MKPLFRLLGLVLLATVALQLYFVGRIALMAVVDPQSTAFERSDGVPQGIPSHPYSGFDFSARLHARSEALAE